MPVQRTATARHSIPAQPQKPLPRPDQIKDFLDRRVVGQEEAKKTLSVAVCNHYKRIRARENPDCKVKMQKSNVVLLGPTGCGKTFLVQQIAEFLDVPFYIQDCTKITASGYVGSDVEDCIVGLLRACNYDINKAQRGIIVLDEGDKIAKKETGVSITRDVSGECVQQSLLKIVEGSVVGVPPFGGRKHPDQPLLFVDTTDILFIVAGAFVGLDDIVASRLNTGVRRIGFTQSRAEEVAPSLEDVTPEDLRDFGLIPEFVGRFPVITYVEPLGKEALMRILTEPENSIIAQYKALMSLDGIELEVAPHALELIAESALSLGTGARGLRSIIEKVMRDVMFDAPRLAQKHAKLVLDFESEDLGMALPGLRRKAG